MIFVVAAVRVVVGIVRCTYRLMSTKSGYRFCG
jgi:hypothetical protein